MGLGQGEGVTYVCDKADQTYIPLFSVYAEDYKCSVCYRHWAQHTSESSIIASSQQLDLLCFQSI